MTPRLMPALTTGDQELMQQVRLYRHTWTEPPMSLPSQEGVVEVGRVRDWKNEWFF